MNSRIYLSPPHMGGDELDLVRQAFAENWVAPAGPQLEAFEKALSRYNAIDHCVALSSGTAAIHLALIGLGVTRGDDVICSSFTFSASCNPIVYQGATPVFVDSENDTWNMDPDLLEEAIQDRKKTTGKTPKAIIVVHLYGMPSKMDEITAVASQHGIVIIEDAAEALGSTYHRRAAGTLGDLGVYSFNGNKIITTSGGGALVSRNDDWIRHARFLSTQARDDAPHYQHSAIGFNYRMSNICACIGLGQMNILDLRVQQKRSVFEYYAGRLKQLPGISFQPEPDDVTSNRWLTTILVDPECNRNRAGREDIRTALEKNNIESRPLWKPMHLQPVFSGASAYTNSTSEKLFAQGLCLPSGGGMTAQQLSSVCDIIEGLILK